MIVSDACLGLVESVVAHFPEVRWQRCVAYRYRNVFSPMPREVAAMLKAIRAQRTVPRPRLGVCQSGDGVGRERHRRRRLPVA